MTASVRQTTWKPLNGLYVRDAGAWKTVKLAWVRDAGSWKQFYLGAVSISSDTANVNLRTIANAAGYVGGNCTITINAGVEIYSTSAGTPALVPGSWPAGVTVKLINLGTISGMGGNGGTNGGGSAGGTALDASAVSGFTLSIDNTGSIVRGGGGGGASSSDQPYGFPGPCCTTISATAGYGGGGGGQGRNGGTAGSGGASTLPYGGTNGSNGSNGSSGAAGAGGAGGTILDGCGATVVTNASGMAGGAWGTAGGTYFGYAGGAAGKAVNGNSNITWVGTGTRTGPVV